MAVVQNILDILNKKTLILIVGSQKYEIVHDILCF